eukprot:281344_1
MTLFFLICLISLKLCSCNEYDPRNVSSGTIMYNWNYLDQPYCIIIPNNTTPYNESSMDIKPGNWVCIITGSPSGEGGRGERVLSLYSEDNGNTWSKPIDVESNTTLPNAYATIAINQYGRIYTMYNFNKNNITTFPNGQPLSRTDELGFFAYKYSDNSGRSWSKDRYIIPYRNTDIDSKNSFNGSVDIMWCVDQTKWENNQLYYAFTKIQNYPQNPPESLWIINSPNIWNEMNINNIKWNLYPYGNYGIQPINNNTKSVSEEGHILPLSDNKGFQMIFRSNEGYLGCSYTNSVDINVNYSQWTESYYCQYANMFGSENTKFVKNPRGPITPKRIISNSYSNNIMYLMLYFNNGANGGSDRNPYWLTSGMEIYNEKLNVTQILWSQPELALFSINENNGKMGYPDIIQYINDNELNVLVTETNKSIARLHRIPNNIIKGLLTQFSLIIDPSKSNVSVVFNNVNQSNINATDLIPGFDINSDYKMDLGFSIFMILENHNESTVGDVMLEYMNDSAGIKIIVVENYAIRIELFDVTGHNFTFNTDNECVKSLVDSKIKQHAFGLIIDGNARILSLFVDGYLCDGSNSQLFGWTWLPKTFQSMNNKQNRLAIGPYSGTISQGYWFTRAMLTSDMVAFYRYVQTK